MIATLREKVEKAVGFVKEKLGIGNSGADGDGSEIRQFMDVIGGDGRKIGVVDCVEHGVIRLTKDDSPDGRHHFITTKWVDRVDNQVHLFVYGFEIEHAWRKEALLLEG